MKLSMRNTYVWMNHKPYTVTHVEKVDGLDDRSTVASVDDVRSEDDEPYIEYTLIPAVGPKIPVKARDSEFRIPTGAVVYLARTQEMMDAGLPSLVTVIECHMDDADEQGPTYMVAAPISSNIKGDMIPPSEAERKFKMGQMHSIGFTSAKVKSFFLCP